MGMGTLGLGVSPAPENSELWRVRRGWPEVVWGLEPWRGKEKGYVRERERER